VGTGVEFALAENWSVKGEWMYYDLGSNTYVVATLPGFDFHTDAETTGEVARVGVNYHFGH
jgi:outer membrane immunogenic protein